MTSLCTTRDEKELNRMETIQSISGDIIGLMGNLKIVFIVGEAHVHLVQSAVLTISISFDYCPFWWLVNLDFLIYYEDKYNWLYFSTYTHCIFIFSLQKFFFIRAWESMIIFSEFKKKFNYTLMCVYCFGCILMVYSKCLLSGEKVDLKKKEIVNC